MWYSQFIYELCESIWTQMVGKEMGRAVPQTQAMVTCFSTSLPCEREEVGSGTQVRYGNGTGMGVFRGKR